jgi:hypothetical protein
MIALNPDLRLIKPTAKTLTVTSRIAGRERIAFKMKVLGNNIRTFKLNFLPPCVEWVEVYYNARRMLTGYTIVGQQLTFDVPHSGRVDVICDNEDPTDLEWCEIPIKNMISYTSLVDANYGTDRRDGPDICQRVIPVVIVQPSAGFCRSSLYFDTLLYCPIKGYEGPDSITYAILNDSGQVSEPKCINITVELPPPPEPPVVPPTP